MPIAVCYGIICVETLHLPSTLLHHLSLSQAFITKPKYCVPFLQPGRLVKVEHGDNEDFGWGAVINFQKKANQKARKNLFFQLSR